MRVLIAVVLATIALPYGSAVADTESKNRKLAQLVEAIGLRDMLSDMMEISSKEINLLPDQILAQMMTVDQLSDPGIQQEVQRAQQRFITTAMNIPVDAAAAQFAKWYGEHVTEAELEQILAFYQSPIGQKDIAASHAANRGFTEWYARQQQQRITEAATTFQREILSILSQSGQL